MQKFYSLKTNLTCHSKLLLLLALLLQSSCGITNQNTKSFGYNQNKQRVLFGRLTVKNQDGSDNVKCKPNIYPFLTGSNNKIVTLYKKKRKNFLKSGEVTYTTIGGFMVMNKNQDVKGGGNIFAYNIPDKYNLFMINSINCIRTGGKSKASPGLSNASNTSGINNAYTIKTNIPIVAKKGKGKIYFGDIYLTMDDYNKSANYIKSDFVRDLYVKNNSKQSSEDLSLLMPELEALELKNSVTKFKFNRKKKNKVKDRERVDSLITNF